VTVEMVAPLLELERAEAFTPTGLVLTDPSLTYERWESIGRYLGALRDATAWSLGDWVLFGERVYGERCYQGVEATGRSKETLKGYAWVASKIPPSRRRPNLPWSLHRLVASMEPELQDSWLDRAEANRWTVEEMHGRLHVQPVTALLSSASWEWYTPGRYIEAARRVLGGIDLDPASSDEANRIVQAARFYTAHDDGLTQPWSGRVWMNPPYCGMTGLFVERLLHAYEAGDVSAGVVLINGQSTEMRWFQPLFDHLLCFTDHRIDFSNPTRDGGRSTHGSCFVYLGANRSGFVQEFGQFGAIVERARA
jgi:phage N-6-adenine-methyltransferase